jgi:hypothetical protein
MKDTYLKQGSTQEVENVYVEETDIQRHELLIHKVTYAIKHNTIYN